ncbi:hypothetical protein VOLCADRAFT_87455 [Volvox carteri f. nagariensis]|uniref:Calcineurin-like phosphoesterase domain-containing protein n=1 Tax=Volvox carteri f. nagariensis TaxID=3068 RepID=D8TLD9_VOLCA|nr:uncharacterized protein VOLCADRAFT_87455 [Volvox carteri f. nagariensis]EFJ51718.1 hypothetical protein VOLCADRAFT_87455 [Volvox carteri f. nagariensis]|eukprot:XP_002947128.1 hypothetical protein VOLCADRAFT_87455 [Volvox carteri f. nagariensis]
MYFSSFCGLLAVFLIDGANGNAGSNLAGSVAESGSGGNGSTLRSAAAAVERSRASDLVSLASGLLARWPVAAALLTGDITEAKDVYGSGRQDEREWRMYRDARTALSSIGRVPYNQIYDIRGNHDTFNSGPRCGAEDWYCTYSARAERFGQGGANGTSGTADRGPQARIFIDAVYGSTDGGNGVGGGSACPVAMVVGVDASLDPGMRSPTNFLGVITQSVLDELDEQLAASIAGMRGANCNPPYIAYGHYPLSTIAYPGRRIAGGAAERAASVHQILVRHGVSAYLAGHLHGAFGRKLHRLHAGPIAGTGAADDNPRGHMLELEMVDWKYARTVRLLTVDPGPGGAVGFADFQFIPPRVGNVVAGNHLADARYSPQLAAVYTSAGGCSIGGSADNGDFGGGKAAVTAVVRVMLLPMSPAVPAVPSGTVYLQWSCDAVGANEVGWGVDFGDAGGGSSRPGGTGAHDPRQQHQQQPQGDESSSPAVTSSGAHGNSSNWRNRDRRLQQGAYQMRLESATANYSIFTVDLLGAEGGEFPGAESSFGSSSSDSVYSCPSGYIVVQAVVGVGRRNSSNDDASVESASAKRLLHWQLPPSQPTPSLRPSSPRRSLFESAGPGRAPEWGGTIGSGGAGLSLTLMGMGAVKSLRRNW